MAANGQLVFTDVDKVTFKGVGNTSNAVIDTTTGKIGVGVDSPDANLHVLGNCFVSTNFELGGTMTMGTVTVRAQHELSAITATGNTTPHTVEFQNATTGFVTTANIEVGTANLFVDTVNSRVGVGTNAPENALHIRNAIPAVLLDDSGDDTKVRITGGTGGDLYMDSNWGGSGNTGDIIFREASSEKMRITGTGNVGIGTTSPVAKFEVYGNTVLSHGSGYTHNSDDRTLYIGGRNNNGSLQQGKCAIVATPSTSHGGGGLYGRNALHFCVGPDANNDTSASKADSRLCITHTGNVGIGTTTPQAPFHVKPVNNNSDVENTLLDFRGDFTGSNHGYLGIFATETHTNAIGPDLRFKGAVYNNTANPAINQVMCLKPNGNVGIGTTNPTYQLDVQGATGYDGSTTFRLLNPASSYGRTQLHLVGRYEGANDGWNSGGARNAIMFKSQSGLNSAITNRWTIQSFPNGTSNDLGFLSGSNNTPRVVFRGTNGNVGIGTSNPTSRLDITQNFAGNGPGVPVAKIVADDGGIQFGVQVGEKTPNPFTRTSLRAVDNGVTVFIVDGFNKRVGIGTTNPDKAKLHVIGSKSTSLTSWYYNASGANAQVTNYSRNLSGYFGNHLACEELQVFSDRRIKTEIEDIDDGSALILFRQIQPKTYKYLDKVERGNERVYGFVAQEIKELMPEAVDVSSGKIPNIYEVANVSNSNVITFTHFNTSNLVSNSNILEVQTVHGDSQSLNIAEVVDEHVIRVDEDLSDWIGSVDESGNVASGNQLFVYGQEVNDFHHLKKSAIWTVTTAALQEVDRQQQADKARITELESQLASVLTRLDALENA